MTLTSIHPKELAAHSFLSEFSQEQIQTLSKIAAEASYDAGQIVFREDQRVDSFYLIVEGRVALESVAPGHLLRIQVLEPGDELGWSWALPSALRFFQARTLEPVRAIVFDSRKLLEACDQDPYLGYLFMRSMLEVVSERLKAAQIQMLEVHATRKG